MVKANEGHFELEGGRLVDLRDPMCRDSQVRSSILIGPYIGRERNAPDGALNMNH